MSDVTTSWTAEELMRLCGVEKRTVQKWQSAKLISFWKEGRNTIFPEWSIAEFVAARYVAARRMDAGEALALARRECREFKGLPMQKDFAEEIGRINREIREIREMVRAGLAISQEAAPKAFGAEDRAGLARRAA